MNSYTIASISGRVRADEEEEVLVRLGVVTAALGGDAADPAGVGDCKGGVAPPGVSRGAGLLSAEAPAVGVPGIPAA